MFDYVEYHKEYNKKYKILTLKMRRDTEKDIIDAIETNTAKSQNEEVKRLIRLGIEASKNK